MWWMAGPIFIPWESCSMRLSEERFLIGQENRLPYTRSIRWCRSGYRTSSTNVWRQIRQIGTPKLGNWRLICNGTSQPNPGRRQEPELGGTMAEMAPAPAVYPAAGGHA